MFSLIILFRTYKSNQLILIIIINWNINNYLKVSCNIIKENVKTTCAYSFLCEHASLRGTWAGIISYASYFSKILTCLEYFGNRFLFFWQATCKLRRKLRRRNEMGGVVYVFLTLLHYTAMQALNSWVHTFFNRVCGWFIDFI